MLKRITIDEIAMLKFGEKGVYAIYGKDDKPIYVGISGHCIKERLKAHLRNKISFSEIIFIEIINMENKQEMIEKEKNLIQEYKPKYNLQIKRTRELFLSERKYMTPDILETLNNYSTKKNKPKHEIISEALDLFFKSNKQ